MKRVSMRVALVACMVWTTTSAQDTAPNKPNRLLTGKLIYVASMPQNLDQWIVEDLRVWGKYKLTGEPEGVDLMIQPEIPERSTELEMRGGVPRPREAKKKQPLPLPGS